MGTGVGPPALTQTGSNFYMMSAAARRARRGGGSNFSANQPTKFAAKSRKTEISTDTKKVFDDLEKSDWIVLELPFDNELWAACEANGLDYKDEREALETHRLIQRYGLGRAGHAHFSPSSSAGWLNCAGFLLANAGRPDVAGEDAAYGTVAHGIAATWLTAIRDEGRKKAEHVPKRFLGWSTIENGYTITCDANMLHHIRRYIDWCHEVEISGDVFIEQRVDYSDYTPIPQQGGTADHFVCTSPVVDEQGNIIEGGVLTITDLKMGMGIWVDVVKNTQAMLYALGVVLEWNWVYNFQKIVIRICQPRLDYFGVWECTIDDLWAFAEKEVRVKAARAWRENAPRSPSPKACQWCAEVDCPARSALLADMTDDVFDDDDEVISGEKTPTYTAEALNNHAAQPLFGKDKSPEFNKTMRVALMAWRYRHRKMFEKYFREIGEELLRLKQSGVHVPGFKIGVGRRSFKWLDPDDAALELSVAGLPESKIFKTEVTSVAESRKELRALGLTNEEIDRLFNGEPPKTVGRKTIAAKPGLVRTVPGRPTLVLDNDPREDLEDATDGVFEDDDDEL